MVDDLFDFKVWMFIGYLLKMPFLVSVTKNLNNETTFKNLQTMTAVFTQRGFRRFQITFYILTAWAVILVRKKKKTNT